MPFCCVLVAQILKHLCLSEVSALCYDAADLQQALQQMRCLAGR